jgi:RecA/RadA recombinase
VDNLLVSQQTAESERWKCRNADQAGVDVIVIGSVARCSGELEGNGRQFMGLLARLMSQAMKADGVFPGQRVWFHQSFVKIRSDVRQQSVTTGGRALKFTQRAWTSGAKFRSKMVM